MTFSESDQIQASGAERARPTLRLTPRQWRDILEDPSFLSDADNRYERPRRFHGLPVEIVPEGAGA